MKFFEKKENTFVIGMILGMIFMVVILVDQGMFNRPIVTEITIDQTVPEYNVGEIILNK